MQNPVVLPPAFGTGNILCSKMTIERLRKHSQIAIADAATVDKLPLVRCRKIKTNKTKWLIMMIRTFDSMKVIFTMSRPR